MTLGQIPNILRGAALLVLLPFLAMPAQNAAQAQRVGNQRAVASDQPHVIAPVQRGWNTCLPHERGQLMYTARGRRITVPAEYSYWVQHYAASEGVPPHLLFALIWHESGFCQKATSRTGAIGLGQLMPATARELGVNPHIAQQNILGTARYLRRQYLRFGRAELALAAYNAGPSRVAACMCVPAIPETQRYVYNIVSMHHSYGR